MFSGIIESVGRIQSISRKSGKGVRLMINAGKLALRLKLGDSIAVDGICLTVVSKNQGDLGVDISQETWSRTNLRFRGVGSPVNLELPVKPGALISGHLVQGHIDGTAQAIGWRRTTPDDVRLRLKVPASLLPYCVVKGSVTINGVSLTIASMRGRMIELALIPYTLERTNLNTIAVGDSVNIETDILGKYVVSTVKKAYHKTKSKIKKKALKRNKKD